MDSLPSLPSRKVTASIVGFFLLAALFVYWTAMGNEFVRWDDGLLIYENPAIRNFSLESLQWIFTHYDPELYIPLTFFTYQMDYLIGGGGPFMFHFQNLLLHTLNALLVAWLSFLLLKRGAAAVIIGLFFLLHPIHTEAVAWASARKDVLSGAWFLISVIFYILWRDRGNRTLYVVSIVAFLLGLMSKVVVITLPVILLLVDGYRGRKIDVKMLLDKVPYLILSVIFGIVAILGKTAVIEKSSTLDKILMAGKSSIFYIQKIFVPTELSVLYPYVGDISIASPDFFIPGILVILLLAAAVAFRKRFPELLFGVAFFFILVAPTFVNFAKGGVDIYFASDRYAYLPSIGIFIAIAGIVLFFLERAYSPRPRDITVGVAGVILLIFAFMSHLQSLTWRSSETLFSNVLKHYPSSHVAHTNIGNVYRRQGRLQDAIAEFQKALAIQSHSRTFSNLGAVYRLQQQYGLAHEQYDKALLSNPESKEAHMGLGLLLAAEGKLADARIEYQRAIAIDPLYEEAYVNLGALSMQEGDIDEAIAAYNRALDVNPYLVDARFNLAVAYSKQGKIEEAIKEYEQTIAAEPRAIAARINVALLYSQQGQNDKAILQFEEILRIDPDNKAALSALRQLGVR